MGFMFLPSVSTEGGKDKNPLLIPGKVVKITDKKTWTQFGKDLVVKDKLQWHLTGKINLRALGRTYSNVNFAKDVDIPGFSGLKNVSITAFSLDSSNSTNVVSKMTVMITQNSTVNIESMGDLTMELYYQNVSIGNGIALNSSLTTGETFMHVSGVIISTPQSLPLLGPLISNYLGSVDSPVVAKIVDCSNPLLKDSLVGIQLNTILPSNPQNLVKSLDFDSVNIVPLNDKIVGMKSGSVISIQQILGPNSPMDILETSLKVDLIWGERVLGNLEYSAKVEGGDKPTFSLPIDGNVSMIQDGKPWATFTEAYVADEKVVLRLKGKMNAKVKTVLGIMELSGLSMESSVTLVGMAGFNDTTVTNLNLPRDAKDGGIKIFISVIMKNPSVATMAMGDLNFLQIYKGEQIGYLVSKNVTLVPGDNHLNLSGSIILPKNESSVRGNDPNRRALQEFFNRYIAGLTSPVTVKGNANTTTNNIPEWVVKVINSLEITTEIQGTNKKIIQGLNLNSMEMSIPGNASSNTDDGYVPFGSSVSSVFVSPFGFNLSTSEVSTKVSILYNGGLAAVMEDYSPWVPSTSNQLLNQLNFTLSGVRFKIVNRTLFEQLSAALVNQPYATFVMEGSASAKVHTAIGPLSLEGVEFSCPVTIKGFNKFPPGDLVMKLPNQGITGGFKWGMTMDVALQINNPTIITLKTELMGMNHSFDGVIFGPVTVYDVVLLPGSHSYVGKVVFYKPQPHETHKLKVMRKFLSHYSDGIDCPLVLYGNEMNAPLLVPGMLDLVSSTVFPGQPSKLLKRTLLNVIPHFFPFDFHVHLTFANPFKVDLIFHKFSNFTVYQVANDGTKTQIGKLEEKVLNPPFVVKAGTYGEAPEPFLLTINSHIISIIDSLIGSTCYTEGVCSLGMEQFGPVQIDFHQFFVVEKKFSQK
eukprot:TRINITY_DN4144_c0_g3_i1.p1 TRINITY_DN4144_c0_g3~~TRINITY_DN4144_c0_g3_i1.p1  ORF type:complete len:1084 (+),score=345.45 TRINITY_DN4144_c0_g3_i1:487-3252(+)